MVVEQTCGDGFQDDGHCVCDGAKGAWVRRTRRKASAQVPSGSLLVSYCDLQHEEESRINFQAEYCFERGMPACFHSPEGLSVLY